MYVLFYKYYSKTTFKNEFQGNGHTQIEKNKQCSY